MIGDALELLAVDNLPLHITAYDGSDVGPDSSEIGLHVATQEGLAYLLTAPGVLGLVRAYVAGDLELRGVHPGDPYPALQLLLQRLEFRRPSPSEAFLIIKGLGVKKLRPPAPPPQERLPRWRRTAQGLRHSLSRDRAAIAHHYDVSNTFYEWLLGPSMTYSCAVFDDPKYTLEQAQAAKYDLVCRKLGLSQGQRLLDIGCGWGGMVRHAAREYGVSALGVTLSAKQADWASRQVKEEGLDHLVKIRLQDYREVPEGGFDAICSIGMSEHLGVANYPTYFADLRSKLRDGGRMLNHCITRPHNHSQAVSPFIDRYVFPDGELTGVGTIVVAAQNENFEIMHVENLRPHYALTLAQWNRNLVRHWEKVVREVDAPTAQVWGLYIAGSRLGFERNVVQLHQVLMTKTDRLGTSGYPIRVIW
jgi:cyclopropane-fatty-acyl-phospholipid synthase